MNEDCHLVAIDLGSNSFHLIVARELTGCIQTVFTSKKSVRLASGLDQNKHLSEEAIQRGLDCLAEFNQQLSGLTCRAVRVVATYSLRVAVNSDEFIERAKAVFPYPIEVISGEKEATLIYQGVAHTYPLKGTTFVMDIGGGSTEFIIGKRFKIKFARSLEMGSRSFATRFFNDDKITADSMRLAQAEARSVLAPIVEECLALGWKGVLGTSGSFKVIKQCMLELHGDSHITEKRVRRLIARFIEAKSFDNLGLSSIEESRFTLTAGALAIVSSFMDEFSVKNINISTSALREGVLYGLSSTEEKMLPRDRTVTNLLHLHRIDQVFSKRVLLQLQLFNQQLAEQGKAIDETRFMFLRYAALMHEIGINIHSKKRQVHGAYIIEHSDMPGFSEQGQQIIAAMVGDHRGKINSPITFDVISKDEYYQIVQLLRLAIILTHGRRDFPQQLAKIKFEGKQLQIDIPAVLFKENDLFAMLEKEVLQQQKAGLSLKVVAEAIEL
ncbi:Ppx/GppA phosphatase family protein [Psychromonas aquatilis]|uniref:Ppx/GppA phosphatase family protein n=1 Tax=Psychromonas aquatilis TaxID=2005072 RepID=A0ABU9GRY9_9GAMM